MKKLLIASCLFFINAMLYAQHSLEKLWQTDSVLKAPESALYDAKSKIIYQSNIGEFQKDGTGFISKIAPDGKIIKRDWVTGLTAAKGLGLYKNLLYAAEQTTVAVIDVNTASVLQHIPVEGSQFLNDVTVDANGIVYVSDSRTNKIHKIENGKVSVYLENIHSVNGLLAVGKDLYILADTILQKADANKKLTTLANGIEGGADGVEMVNAHEFLVTGWEGTIYYVKDDGTRQVLLDGRDKKINAADLGYDRNTNTIYVPAMLKNMLVAYKLN